MESPRTRARKPRFFTEPNKQQRSRLRRLQDVQIHAYLAGLDTARSLAIWIAYKYGEHADIPLFSYGEDQIDAWVWEGGVEHARKCYAATKLLRKFGGLRLAVDKARVALEKTRACEESNRVSNQRFAADMQASLPLDFQHFISDVRREILAILGSSNPTVDYEAFGFTPGSTVDCLRINSSQLHKYQSSLVVTGRGITNALRVVNAAPLWASGLLNADGPCSILRGALGVNDVEEIFTVAKDATTDRTCARFNPLTVAFQRQVGKHIASRLKSSGIDVSDQGPNQTLAWAGSRDGSLSTIDMSSASDLISRNLVKLLFSRVQTRSGTSDALVDFEVNHLAAHRATDMRWPDGSHSRAERYSAMGCGFTFELMTLIFVAAARATGARVVGAFGDDLVLDVRHTAEVCERLNQLGFIVNTKKSFTAPYPGFRESCGSDWYKGHDFKVPHLDDRATSLADLVKFQNRDAELAARHGASGYLEHLRPRLRNFYAREGMKVPYGPFGFGDGHIIAPFDAILPKVASTIPRYRGWEGFLSRTFVAIDRPALVFCEGRGLVLSDKEAQIRSRRGVHTTGVEEWTQLCASLHALEKARGGEYVLRETSSFLKVREPVSVTRLCVGVEQEEKCVDLVWLDSQLSLTGFHWAVTTVLEAP